MASLTCLIGRHHPFFFVSLYLNVSILFLFSKSSTGMNEPRKPTVTPNKPTVASHDDPFLVFETALSTASSESFLDSLEQMSKMNNSKGTRSSSSTSPSLKPPPKPMNVSNSSKGSFKYLS